jgi:hypothetical protein
MPKKTPEAKLVASIMSSIASLSLDFSARLRKIEAATALLAKSTGQASNPVSRGPGRPRRSDAEAKCLVGACSRRSVANKLCPVHYRKAKHLKFKPPFSAKQLAILAKDGRSLRWAKAKRK